MGDGAGWPASAIGVEVADELGCDWHTAMDAVVLFGEPLIDDPSRYGKVAEVGLDETLYVRAGRYRRQRWSTQVVDVQAGQLLDVLDCRDLPTCCARFAVRPTGSSVDVDRRRWICRPANAACSTRRPRIRFTLLALSMWCGWGTQRSTCAVGGCRTKQSATAAARTTRSTVRAAGW